MAENLFADFDDQQVELLPARTVLTTLAWHGGDDSTDDNDVDESGNGNAGSGLLGLSALNPTA